MTVRALLVFLFIAGSALAARPLKIFLIDVEGGQATLIVSPAGKSLLIDSGWGDRDAERIIRAAKAAHLRQIDYFLLTHYHRDHAGGIAPLRRRIPVMEFLDHGPNTEAYQGAELIVQAYEAAWAGKAHKVIQPGDSINLGGIQISILSSNGRNVPAGDAPVNPACSTEPRKEDELTENAHSAALVLRYGRFRFLDLGDILWNQELDLVCPQDRIGKVGAVLVTHHGKNTSFPATLMRTIRPQVAIMNNATAKGGSLSTIRIIRQDPANPDLWQLHRSNEAAAENPAEQFVANPGPEDRGYGILLEALFDGRFKIVNQRTGRKKTYQP